MQWPNPCNSVRKSSNVGDAKTDIAGIKNSKSNIKGFKVAHQSKGKWIEEFDERLDPAGNKYFWLTGKFINSDKSEKGDQNILDKNFVSIVPISHDLTHNDQIIDLKNIFDE